MAPIVTADIELRFTIKGGSAGNTTAQGSGALSLGKYVSTTVATTTKDSLFPALSAADNASGTRVEYLALALYNKHATNTWRAPKLWLTDPAGGTSLAIAVDSVAASAVGSASAQGLEVANITTAPAALSFSSPSSYGSGLALGDIPPGYVKFFWIRRSAANSAALTEAPLFEWLGGTLG